MYYTCKFCVFCQEKNQAVNLELNIIRQKVGE